MTRAGLSRGGGPVLIPVWVSPECEEIRLKKQILIQKLFLKTQKITRFAGSGLQISRGRCSTSKAWEKVKFSVKGVLLLSSRL